MFGAMKIVGGTFGTRGYAWLRKDQSLDIKSDRKRVYPQESVRRVEARTESQKNFGCFSFIFGAIIFGAIFGFLIPGIGIIIGLVIAVALSFYTTKKQIVEITLGDDEKVVVECAGWQVRRLVGIKQ